MMIFAARGEREAFQVVFASKNSYDNVSLTSSDLSGPGKIPAGNVQVLWVEYVNVRQPSGSHGKTGLNPDPLPAQLRGGLKAGRNLAAWITVNVPRGTPAGQYRGALTASLNGTRIEIPYGLTVWDFDLPQKRKLIVESSFRPRDMREYGEDDWESMQRYLRNMAEHGVNATGTMRPSVRPTADGDGSILHRYL
jgi:hypothetical protein